MAADPGNGNDTVLERLAQRLEHRAGEFRELVEKEHAAMRKGDFTGTWTRPTAHDRRSRGSVVGSAKGRHRHEGPVRREQARNGVDAGHLESFLPRERRKDPRQAPSEHRLSGAGRTREQQVVRAGRSNLERPTSSFLAAHVRQVEAWRSCELVVRQRLEGRHVDLAAEVRDNFGQVTNGNRLDARERRLRCRFGGADQSSQPRAPSSFGDRERAGHGPNSPVQRELAYRRMLSQAFGRELPGRGENSE
jgi:hypothetical protein